MAGTPAQDPRQTPGPGTAEHKIQKDETIDHRQFAAIDDRPETVPRMLGEVGNRHFAAAQKGNRTNQQPDHDQRTSDELNVTGDFGQAGQGRGWDSAKKTKGLLKSVTHECKADDDPED